MKSPEWPSPNRIGPHRCSTVLVVLASSIYRAGHFCPFVYGSFCGMISMISKSLSLPIYALISASSFSGSPLWGFALTRRVAAPAVTLFWSLITICLNSSASGVLARLTFAPHPIHLCLVIAWWEASLLSSVLEVYRIRLPWILLIYHTIHLLPCRLHRIQGVNSGLPVVIIL